jgi:hypothetical protein
MYVAIRIVVTVVLGLVYAFCIQKHRAAQRIFDREQVIVAAVSAGEVREHHDEDGKHLSRHDTYRFSVKGKEYIGEIETDPEDDVKAIEIRYDPENVANHRKASKRSSGSSPYFPIFFGIAIMGFYFFNLDWVEIRRGTEKFTSCLEAKARTARTARLEATQRNDDAEWLRDFANPSLPTSQALFAAEANAIQARGESSHVEPCSLMRDAQGEACPVSSDSRRVTVSRLDLDVERSPATSVRDLGADVLELSPRAFAIEAEFVKRVPDPFRQAAIQAYVRAKLAGRQSTLELSLSECLLAKAYVAFFEAIQEMAKSWRVEENARLAIAHQVAKYPNLSLPATMAIIVAETCRAIIKEPSRSDKTKEFESERPQSIEELSKLMNRKQLLVMWVAIVVLVAMWLYPPWMYKRSWEGYDWLFSGSGHSIVFSVLGVQSAIVVLVAAGLIVTFRGKR